MMNRSLCKEVLVDKREGEAATANVWVASGGWMFGWRLRNGVSPTLTFGLELGTRTLVEGVKRKSEGPGNEEISKEESKR
jgi:hypothetical protein